MRPRRKANRFAPPQIKPLGDSALVVRFGEFEEDKSLDEVSGAMRKIEHAGIPGIVDLAPGYATLGIFFDPTKIIDTGVEPQFVNAWLEEKIAESLTRRLPRDKRKVRSIEIPACFDHIFAVDLAEVATHSGMPADEVVDLYCATEFRVVCLGFTAGFPYLAGLPEKLATPRRANPRKEIAAGSIAIGGKQTGIYPSISPGGWNIIGRAALRLFDPANDPPAFLQAGDCVRFSPITREQFERSTS
ncbi:MAG: 5-oxoprolinase subunit PxpB [Spartobacteria bacterium]